MRVGILATGITPIELIEQYGSYADMFVQLFTAAGREYEYRNFDVRDGVFPESIDVCDAWVITGSASNVDENREWMQKLRDLILKIDAAGQPLVGICFGHQIIAEAFGGRVEAYAGGWGTGLHQYDIVDKHDFSATVPTQITLNAMHRYQVTRKPDRATVIAQSEFCQFAALAYGHNILTFQAHPEFTLEFEDALLDIRDGDVIPSESVKAARASMQVQGAKTDSPLVAQWMAEVLERR